MLLLLPAVYGGIRHQGREERYHEPGGLIPVKQADFVGEYLAKHDRLLS